MPFYKTPLDKTMNSSLNYHPLTMSKTVFNYACKNGHLELAQHVWMEYDADFRHDEIRQSFVSMCGHGHLLLVQWFLSWQMRTQFSLNINHYDTAFRFACINGHLPVAEWLLHIRHDIRISANRNYTFRGVCCNGHIHVAQWLLSIHPNISTFLPLSGMDYAFKCACINGKLNMAQWLLSIRPELMVLTESDDLFKNICDKWDFSSHDYMEKRLLVAQWFASLHPDKYQDVSYDTENGLIHYKIVRKINIIGTLVLPKEECGICKEMVCDIATECNHPFCQGCIQQWLDTNRSSGCPTCRHPMSLNTSVFRQLV